MSVLGQFFYLCFTYEPLYITGTPNVERRRSFLRPRSLDKVRTGWKQARRNARAQQFYDAQYKKEMTPRRRHAGWVIASALLLLSLSSRAQTAKVIALSNDDAATARRLYEQKAAIEKQLEAFKAKVKHDYIAAAARKPQDWPWGFVLSEDFKYIVPDEPPKYTGPSAFCNSYVLPNAVWSPTARFD